MTKKQRQAVKWHDNDYDDDDNSNQKHWDSAYLRQGTSYQCRDADPDPYP